MTIYFYDILCIILRIGFLDPRRSAVFVLVFYVPTLFDIFCIRASIYYRYRLYRSRVRLARGHFRKFII